MSSGGFKRPPILPKATHSNFVPLYTPKEDEPTIWELCNQKAAPIDRDIIKDWTDTLTFLLVFVSNFRKVPKPEN